MPRLSCRRPEPEGRLLRGDMRLVLPTLPEESVDLAYLDPPFGTGRDFGAYDDRSGALSSMTANQDPRIETVLSLCPNASRRSWLAGLGECLVAVRRVLKMTGSLYIHCDPSASHYLKLVLDVVFGADNFRNEIIWQRTAAKGISTRKLPNNHDTILVYQRGESPTWNADAMFTPYDDNALDVKTDEKYSLTDEDGRRYQLTSLISPSSDRPNLTYEFLGITRVWRWERERMLDAHRRGEVVQTSPGTVPRQKRYLDEQRGKPIGDVWTDIAPVNSRADERLGYPTQKPVSLLKRIINASSNPGDVVLDPCAGSGTTLAAASSLGRRWIGIDKGAEAIRTIEKRLGVTAEAPGGPDDVGIGPETTASPSVLGSQS